jgi:hypothetical protein
MPVLHLQLALFLGVRSQQHQITAIKKAKPKSLAEILIRDIKKKNR